MKETELNLKVKTELSVKQKKQVEYDFVKDIVPHNGHTLWKINNETLEVTEAEYLKRNYVFGEDVKREVLIKEGFTYISALNKKNAFKNFSKGKIGGKEIDENPLTI